MLLRRRSAGRNRGCASSFAKVRARSTSTGPPAGFAMRSRIRRGFSGSISRTSNRTRTKGWRRSCATFSTSIPWPSRTRSRTRTCPRWTTGATTSTSSSTRSTSTPRAAISGSMNSISSSGRNYLVTYHNEPLPPLELLRRNIERDPEKRLKHGADHVALSRARRLRRRLSPRDRASRQGNRRRPGRSLPPADAPDPPEDLPSQARSVAAAPRPRSPNARCSIALLATTTPRSTPSIASISATSTMTSSASTTSWKPCAT